MDNDIRMLNAIRQTAQLSCHELHAVMGETLDQTLLGDLRNQLQSYHNIYSQADRLLRQREAEKKNISPLLKYRSGLSAKLQVRASTDPGAKIASVLMQRNTRNMTKSIQDLRSFGILDPKVSSLSKQLLQTEQAHIEQLKQYL